jgi:hypothetical protein
LEVYKHLINFAESVQAASDFLVSLLNENLQKMVDFTTSIGLVEIPVAEPPLTHVFAHRPNAVIPPPPCPTSRKRKCKISRRAGEYSKKKKCTTRANESIG